MSPTFMPCQEDHRVLNSVTYLLALCSLCKQSLSRKKRDTGKKYAGSSVTTTWLDTFRLASIPPNCGPIICRHVDQTRIGAPISAPIAQMLYNIPILLPKSPISPNAG